jgi:hypothetical protein
MLVSDAHHRMDHHLVAGIRITRSSVSFAFVEPTESVKTEVVETEVEKVVEQVVEDLLWNDSMHNPETKDEYQLWKIKTTKEILYSDAEEKMVEILQMGDALPDDYFAPAVEQMPSRASLAQKEDWDRQWVEDVSYTKIGANIVLRKNIDSLYDTVNRLNSKSQEEMKRFPEERSNSDFFLGRCL